MNGLTIAKDGEFGRAPAGIEDRLIWLCRFGTPRVFRMNQGWHSAIEMNTNTTGAKFEIMSAFDCKTPSESVEQLISRMVDALGAIGEAA